MMPSFGVNVDEQGIIRTTYNTLSFCPHLLFDLNCPNVHIVQYFGIDICRRLFMDIINLSTLSTLSNDVDRPAAYWLYIDNRQQTATKPGTILTPPFLTKYNTVMSGINKEFFPCL